MATAFPNGKTPSEVLCKYYANNACNKGTACLFSHDRTTKPDRNCTYFMSGRCSFGIHCRYDHKRVRPDERNNNKSSTNEEGTMNAAAAKAPVKLLDAAAKAPVKPSDAAASGEHKFSPSAKEFVPGWLGEDALADTSEDAKDDYFQDMPMCPYNETGCCDNGEACTFLHGDICELCNVPCLHPFDEGQRKQHHIECVTAHETAMNEAFAEARSADKTCGICMENIREKNARFGILVGCRHCFCLECIREWRKHHSQVLDKKTVRSCPECRTHSHYVIPAAYWVEDEAEKRELIEKFHGNTKLKQCKYVKQGNMDGCPFGNKCFYKHETPQGVVVEGDSPRTLRRRRGDFDGFLYMHEVNDWLEVTSSDSDDQFDDVMERFTRFNL